MTKPQDPCPAMVLEEVALIILRDMKLLPDYRKTLEDAVRVARIIQKLPLHPEVKP